MRIRFIYNEKSGRARASDKLNRIVRYLLEDGHEVSFRLTHGAKDATRYAAEAEEDGIDRLVVVGGDGTVNEAVGGLVEVGSSIPMFIIPEGTTNDFATYMGFKKSDWEIFSAIVGDKIEVVDVGKCRDRYFINVGAVGLFTSVAHNTPKSLKAAVGRTAYILKGVSEFATEGMRAMNLSVKSEEFTEDLRAYLFLITNSQSVGGFSKMAPLASVKDGLLDCIIIRDMPISELLTVLMRILDGEHINHPSVVYFKTKKLELSCDEEVELDIDGEYFGDLPATFEVVPQALNLLVGD
ncbi:MAG: diacylglycerol kinase family lipid kinase [Ezakiella sp.]|nr:diacylglycerol kinase family lipid kinase [Ezakiella sp.]MDY3947289.1 diacylglycerol kinase family lipid kinase [Ezakiella sp.]